MWKSYFKCSKNSDYTFQVFDDFAQVDVPLWNSLNFENSVYLSSDYLLAFQVGMQKNLDFKYLVFYSKENTAIGIAVFQIYAFKPAELLQNRIPNKIANRIQNFFLEDKFVNLLFCGNLFACGETGFSHHTSVSKSEMLENINDAIAEIQEQKINGNKISFTVFKEFWPTSFDNSDFLIQEKYQGFFIDVNMVVPIEKYWTSMEKYLKQMNTKYRTRAKSVFKKSETIVRKEMSVADIEFHHKKIAELYNNIVSKTNYNLGELDTKVFISLKEKLPNEFLFYGYFYENEFIGFSSAFLFESILDANFVGLDYRFNKTHKLYQRILYDYVDIAIENNCTELRLGRTAETSKSSIGAKPVSMKLYTRHRNHIPTKLMKPLVSSIEPDTYELRNPFKE